MNRQRRLISLLLIVSILLSTLYLPGGAREARASGETSLTGATSISEDAVSSAVCASAGTPVDLATEAILKYVNQDAFRASNHTLRLASEESLNTYVYLNQDGSKTVYIMDENVKYVDAQGQIQNKDVSLVTAKNGYTVAKNDISVFIPTNAANGVQLSHEIGNLKLIPQNSLLVVAGRQEGNSVLYSNYFGKGISLRYTPILSGVKEDIILASYTGVHSFQFALETNGLSVYSDEVGGYYVAASQDADERYSLGEIIVYDGVGRPSLGNLTVKTVTAGARYILTVSADPAFLTDPDTVYPVTIDPSITLGGANDTNNQIWDVPIFSGKPSGAFGAYQYLTLGNADTYGTGRVVVKLPGLYNSSVYNSISYTQINSVYFYCSDGSGNATQYVNLYANTGNTAWTESDATWNSIGANTYDTTYNWGANVPYGSWAVFDITGLVRYWKTGTYNKEAGFRLIHSDEVTRANHKAIHSSEYATASYRPYVVMNYSNDIDINDTAVSIVEGGTKVLNVTTNPPGLSVNWTSSNSSVATVSSTGVVTAIKAGTAVITATPVDGSAASSSCTVYVHIQDGVYYIQNIASEMYLHTRSGDIYTNTPVYQYTKYSDSTSEITKLRQQWRIHYLGNGYYSIRPLHRMIMGLSVKTASSDIVIDEIGETDTLSHVSNLFMNWTVEWNSTGYVFQRGGFDSNTLGVEITVDASGEPIVAMSYDSSSTAQRWNLSKMINPPSGIILYEGTSQAPVTNESKYYIAKDQRRTIYDFDFRMAVYSSDLLSQSFTWTSGAPTIASVDSVTGAVTGKGAGICTLTAGKTVNGTYYSVSFSVEVTPLPMGTYFLKNKQTGYYADIQSQTMANGTTIHQWQFHGGDTQKWFIKPLDNGFYTITSENSGTPYYLGVINDSSGLNVDVVLRSGTVTNGMKWKIEETSSGAYKLMPLSGLQNGYVLATTTSDATNGAKLIQGAYVYNDSYRDEWLIALFFMDANLYYDNAFNIRYSDAPGLIEQMTMHVDDIFWDTMGLSINFKTPTMVRSTPDLCKISRGLTINSGVIDNVTHAICPANPSVACSCSYFITNSADDAQCENCTSWYQIYRDFISLYPGGENRASVLLTGNRLYDDNGVQCNRSYKWYGNGLIMQEIKSSSSTYYTNQLHVMVHEFAHIVGAPDHYHEFIKNENGDYVCRGGIYCNQCNSNGGRPSWCIMDGGSFGPSNYNTDMIFCDGCASDIQNYLSLGNYH